MPVINITGALSPHVDDTVTLNGRLDPTNSSWMKVSNLHSFQSYFWNNKSFCGGAIVPFYRAKNTFPNFQSCVNNCRANNHRKFIKWISIFFVQIQSWADFPKWKFETQYNILLLRRGDWVTYFRVQGFWGIEFQEYFLGIPGFYKLYFSNYYWDSRIFFWVC